MSDYLGPLTFGAGSDTYALKSWAFDSTAGSIAVSLTVNSTSADNLALLLEALTAQLRQGNSYAHFSPGVTNPTVYRVLGVDAIKLEEPVTWAGFSQRVSFTMYVSALPAGGLVTPYNAATTNLPTSVLLSTLLGTNPPPLDVTIDDASALDMHSVWAALAPTALSDAKWRIYPTTATFTTMTAGSGAAYWNNTNVHTSAVTYQTGVLDTSQHPAGKYRLLARVCQDAGTGFIKDSQNDDAIAVMLTTPHLLVLGDLDLPTADTAPGTAAPLTISVKSDGTNTCTLNALLLLPLDYGYFSWHHAETTSEIDKLDVGPSGIYMDDVCDATYLQGSILVPRVLAAHAVNLVTAPSPIGITWPIAWARSGTGNVTALNSTFRLAATGVDAWVKYGASVLGCPLVIPGAWYELDVTRSVSARTSGSAYAGITWLDIDGNQVRVDVLSTASTTDASPVNLELYAKAPMHAARAQVWLGTSGSATLTVAFSGVILRRCPLRLILVAEDAGGALVGNVHPVALTVKYAPRY